MSRLISWILVLCFVFQVPVQATEEAQYRPTSMERYVFLNAVMERVDYILQANHTKLKTIGKCFQNNWGTIDSSVKAEKCDPIKSKYRNIVRTKFDSFKQHVFNLNLMYRFEMLLRLYRANAEGSKEAWSLEDLFIQHWVHPAEDIDSVNEAPEYQYSEAEIQHFLKDDSLSVTELAKEGEQQGQLITHPYAYNLEGHFKMMCDMFRGAKTTFCSKFQLEYSKEKGGFYFPNASYDYDAERELIENWHGQVMLSHGEYLTILIRDRFLRAMQTTPYVALVSSAEPTDAEFVRVFKFMYDSSAAEMGEVSEREAKAKKNWKEHSDRESQRIDQLAKLQKQFDRVKGTRHEDYYREQIKYYSQPVALNENAALSFMDFSHVVNDVLESPSFNMQTQVNSNFQNVAGALFGDHASQELKKVGWMIAGAIGSTMLCYVPVTKVPKLGAVLKALMSAKRLNVAKLLCLSGTALAANTFFLMDSMEIYERTYRRVFSTLEGSVLLGELGDLADADFGLALEILLYPAGVGVIGGGWKFLKKLTPASRRAYEKAVLEAARDAA